MSTQTFANVVRSQADEALRRARIAPEQPRTWTFTNAVTHEVMLMTCLPGCQADHEYDKRTPTHPEDIWCRVYGREMTLPVDSGHGPEERPVLAVDMNVRPFSPLLAERVPHASVEVMDQDCIENLAPEGLAHVIDTLAAQVDRMREAHTQLVQLRAHYRRPTLAALDSGNVRRPRQASGVRKDAARPAEPGHFPWCDHGGRWLDPDRHESRSASLPNFTEENSAIEADSDGALMSSTLVYDESFTDARTELHVGMSGNGVLLDADGAVAFAERLELFAARIRQQAAQMGEEKRP
ncbi:hypothetical protein ADL21_06365 [Streptomyces albus subsp. albus]|nr:hypothetical protein ADL21_06365 [Streptomyces albus subsp. albus]